MESKVDICNLALTHLRVGTTISSLEEGSQEAIVCNQFFEMSRRDVLRGYRWPFATVFRKLSLVEEKPSDEWRYSYRYPVNCLKIIRIKSYTRNDSHQSRVSFKIVQDDSGLLIYTDKKSAEIEYIKDTDSIRLFPDDFILALSFRLAYYLATRIVTGDTGSSMRQELLQYYEHEIQKARNNASNEEQDDQRPLPKYIRARMGLGGNCTSSMMNGSNPAGVSIG